jgi:cell filamentation protein
MSRYSGRDHCLDPESGVLKNRLGITDAATLEQAEAALVATRSYELSRTPLKGRFDLATCKLFTATCLAMCTNGPGNCATLISARAAIYSPITPTSAAPPGLIFQQLAGENRLAELSLATFSDRAAHYLGELNALHPFREGNGTAQREFVSHLALAVGYYVAWENMKQPDMLQASVRSFKGDTSELAALISENIHTVGLPSVFRSVSEKGA